MLFSVLMAHYNNAKYLQQSLDSVIAQTYRHWELVLVDDGSTDEFEEVIARYDHEPRIRVFRNGINLGTAVTKSKCARLGKGEIAGFLDADDALHPDAIRSLVSLHREYPHASIVHSSHFICDESLAVIRKTPFTKPMPQGIPYLLLGDGSIHHFVSYKKRCLEAAGGLTPTPAYNKASDQELYYLLEENGTVVYLDQPLYYYRIHPGSISNLENVVTARIQHYHIIEAACRRRIRFLYKSKEMGWKQWVKKYRLRLYKVKILRSYREREWWTFSGALLAYIFSGGMPDLFSYLRKLPAEGHSMLRRTFYDEQMVRDPASAEFSKEI